jgi:ubiquinone/menaquinone biosynthesis C-methylase UbiE
MEHIERRKTIRFYDSKLDRKIGEFNKERLLNDYFEKMIGDKKEVTIAELGAGPVCTIGNVWPGTNVNLYASDLLWDYYQKMWERRKLSPVVPIERQDMESLTYPDEMFDIVHCVNALDHCLNPMQALKEMQRVCKKDGWIYLRHKIRQKERNPGGMHYWNIDVMKGALTIWNDEDKFILDNFNNSQHGGWVISERLNHRVLHCQ